MTDPPDRYADLIERINGTPDAPQFRDLFIEVSVALHDAQCRIEGFAEMRLDRFEAKSDAKLWRHIAQEMYAARRRERVPPETGYKIEGALDYLFVMYRRRGKWAEVFCRQCERTFGPNYHGYSKCADHEGIDDIGCKP